MRYRLTAIFGHEASSEQHAEVMLRTFLERKGVRKDTPWMPLLEIKAEKI